MRRVRPVIPAWERALEVRVPGTDVVLPPVWEVEYRLAASDGLTQRVLFTSEPEPQRLAARGLRVGYVGRLLDPITVAAVAVAGTGVARWDGLEWHLDKARLAEAIRRVEP